MTLPRAAATARIDARWKTLSFSCDIKERIDSTIMTKLTDDMLSTNHPCEPRIKIRDDLQCTCETVNRDAFLEKK